MIQSPCSYGKIRYTSGNNALLTDPYSKVALVQPDINPYSNLY